MSKLKASELRKMGRKELQTRLKELTSELSKLRSGTERGVLRKETGQIRNHKRNIARLLTVLNQTLSEEKT